MREIEMWMTSRPRNWKVHFWIDFQEWLYYYLVNLNFQCDDAL